MRTLPLSEQHKKLTANFAEFGGFEMPMQYSSAKDEALSVRESCGIFDVSHMGEFFITGPQAAKFVQYLITNEIESAPNGSAVYSPLCRNDGTIIDDLIAYKITNENILICVNAANQGKDREWIEKNMGSFDCKLNDRSHEFCLLAIQGPKAHEYTQKLGLPQEIHNLKSFQIFSENDLHISRTGYTGEDGFEIFCSANKAEDIWKKAMDLKITPCALAARDVLRLEACLPLYGQDLSDHVTPLESALKWTVKMDKKDFLGKAALEKLTPTSRLIKISLEKGIPRQGHKIIDDQNQQLGEVTSGTYSPLLSKGIALARVDKEKWSDEKKSFVSVRNKTYAFKRHKKSFLKEYFS